MRSTRAVFVAGTLAAVSLAPLQSHGASVSPNVQVNADADAAYSHIGPVLVARPGDSSDLAIVDVKRTGTEHGYTAFGDCVAHASSDGGATWTSTVLPRPEGTKCRRATLPKAAFGADGSLYAAYFVQQPSNALTATLSAAPTGAVPEGSIMVARSTDGGFTFGTPVALPAAPIEKLTQTVGARAQLEAFPRGIALAADPSNDNVYAAWSYGRARFALWFSRSTDRGATWSPPEPITVPTLEIPFHVNQFGIYRPSLAAAGGKVFLAFNWLSCADYYDCYVAGAWYFKLVATWSTDGGRTFRDSKTVYSFWPNYDYNGGLPPAPPLAVDPSDPDRVYLGYEDQVQGDVAKQLYVLRTVNGGTSWEQPVRVSDDPYENAFPHERLALSVAPGGRLDAAWYDGRNDPTSPGTNCPAAPAICAGRDVYYTYSLDRGASFAPNVRVTPASFSAKTRRIGEGGIDALGAIGMVSSADGVRLAWEESDRVVSVPDASGTPRDVTIWDIVSATITH